MGVSNIRTTFTCLFLPCVRLTLLPRKSVLTANWRFASNQVRGDVIKLAYRCISRYIHTCMYPHILYNTRQEYLLDILKIFTRHLIQSWNLTDIQPSDCGSQPVANIRHWVSRVTRGCVYKTTYNLLSRKYWLYPGSPYCPISASINFSHTILNLALVFVGFFVVVFYSAILSATDFNLLPIQRLSKLKNNQILICVQ